MDVSRLLEVLTEIEAEFQAGYSKLLQAIVQAYTGARDNPTQDFSEQIAGAHKRLAEHLAESMINDYPPSKKHILEAIGGVGLVDSGAERTLQNRLSGVGMTGAALVTASTEFVNEVERFRKACAQAKAGLAALEVAPHSLESGQYEVGVLIPYSVTSGTLAGLKDQLNDWNTVLKGFSELAGEPEREISLKGVATGSTEVYVAVGLLTAQLISHTIDKILSWYKQILEIQEHRLKLAKLGAPVAETASIKQHEKKLLDDAVTEIVRELMEQAKPKLQSTRKQEIETQLTISVRQIARFIDKGGDVEVTAGAPEVPDEPEEPPAEEGQPAEVTTKYLNEKREYEMLSAAATEAYEISRKGAALTSLPAREKPILQLGDGGDDEVDGSGAKARKK